MVLRLNKTLWFALAAAVAMYILIVIGGVVRVSGSGLGCSNYWPTCKGGIGPLPPLNIHGLIEFSHRGMASVVSVLVGCTALGAWVAHRRERWTAVPAALLVALLLLQIVLGAITVKMDLSAPVVAVHYANALLTFGMMLTVLFGGARGSLAPRAGHALDNAKRDKLPSMALGALIGLFIVVVAGSFVVGTVGAGSACGGYPLCGNRQIIPTFGSPAFVQMAHRAFVLLVSLHILSMIPRVLRSRRGNPEVRLALFALVGLLLLQALVGALDATGGPTWLDAVHEAGAAAVWGAAVVFAVLAYRSRPSMALADGARSTESGRLRERDESTTTVDAVLRRAFLPLTPVLATASLSQSPYGAVSAVLAPAPPASSATGDTISPPSDSPKIERAIGRRGARAVLRDYIAMLKLRISTLLLATTFGAMVIASGGRLNWLTVAITMAAGTLAAGASGVFNAVIERDRDRRMKRTWQRPVASGRVPVAHALTYGGLLTIASCGMMLLLVNGLSAALMAVGIAYYVLVYTVWLKPTTFQGVVIGGACGAIPPLVGWAAVTGNLSVTAFFLFVVVFFWQPPHFWALSLMIEDDYREGNYPMLPLVMGRDEARRQILLHSVVLFAVTMLGFGLRLMGPFYLVSALVLSAVWLWLALSLYEKKTLAPAKALFHYSLLYLALLFLAMGLDRTLFRG